MGCSNSSCSTISPNPHRCIVWADRMYALRRAALGRQLGGIHDLVNLIESYIPVDSPYLPVTYVYGKRQEFYQPKPRRMFEHSVWNYYSAQNKGVALYVIIGKTYQDAIWVDETILKLQILDLLFKTERHPNCLRGFRLIVQNTKSMPPHQLTTIVNHFSFWIERLNQRMSHSPLKSLELSGFFPLVWIIFAFLLRSKQAPLFTKTKIIEFLDNNPLFRASIRNHWSNLGGEFLEALGEPAHLWRERIQQKI